VGVCLLCWSLRAPRILSRRRTPRLEAKGLRALPVQDAELTTSVCRYCRRTSRVLPRRFGAVCWAEYGPGVHRQSRLDRAFYGKHQPSIGMRLAGALFPWRDHLERPIKSHFQALSLLVYTLTPTSNKNPAARAPRRPPKGARLHGALDKHRAAWQHPSHSAWAALLDARRGVARPRLARGPSGIGTHLWRGRFNALREAARPRPVRGRAASARGHPPPRAGPSPSAGAGRWGRGTAKAPGRDTSADRAHAAPPPSNT